MHMIQVLKTGSKGRDCQCREPEPRLVLYSTAGFCSWDDTDPSEVDPHYDESYPLHTVDTCCSAGLCPRSQHEFLDHGSTHGAALLSGCFCSPHLTNRPRACLLWPRQKSLSGLRILIKTPPNRVT
eukprot:g70335.t1